MAMRITQNMMATRFQNDVQSIYERMARTQQQLSDGRRIVQPSDDPIGTGKVIGFDAQLADVRQYATNVRDSIGFMGSADAALGQAGDTLQRIRELMVKASNGVNSPADLNSIAAEITQLKDGLRSAVNARHGSQYIFSGTASDQAPYAGPANAYSGTGNVMSRRIGDGQSVQINLSGETVMGVAPANTLDLIDQMVADLQANSTAALPGYLGGLDTAIDRVLDSRTQLGAAAQQLEATGDRLAVVEERLLAARTEVADIDLAEAYSRFTMQQTMYQAALSSGSRMMQTSILDFI